MATANAIGEGQEEEKLSTSSTPIDAEIDVEDERESTHRQSPDFEKITTRQDARPLELSRTVSSGPPYSIFSRRAKIFIVMSVSISSLISPFGATTFYPALDTLATTLDVTPTLINLSLTTYMIAQAIAPALIAGMSDNNGRRLSYIICFIIFMLANIGLALQTNYAALLVLRMVQAFGCSAAIALSNAVVADIATSAERGRYMGYAVAGLLIGPAFGPTIGGVFAQYLGWRWTFWFLVIFAGFLLIVFGAFFPETCRNVVGNGSIPARGVNQSILGYLQQRRHLRETGDDGTESIRSVRTGRGKVRMPNPLLTLKILGEKESCLVLLYNGFFFLGMMIVTAAIPTLYARVYKLNTLDIGLCYIAMGSGSFASTISMGHVVDWNFRRHAKRLGMVITKGKQQDLTNFPIERVRLEVVIPSHILGCLGVLLFGWTLDFGTNLAGPEIALFMIGFGVSTAFNITNTLLLDLHRDKPATATAAVNFVRCLLSAGGAAAIIPMTEAMGIGWAFTFVAIVLMMFIGLAVLLIYKGQQWRAEMAEAQRVKDEKRRSEMEEEYGERGSRETVEEKEIDDKASS